MNNRRSILVLGILLFGVCGILRSQCTYPVDFILPEIDTVGNSIIVEGLVNDDLAGSQGVCGILARFRHEVIGDVNVRLISPAGQVVHLIGNAPVQSGFTSGTTWDITFVPSASPASPDPLIAPFYNNLQNWGVFGSYTGTYYPFGGNLEDYNSGSANGTWTVLVEDQTIFYEGVIESFTILFCDPTGLSCENCELEQNGLSMPDSLYCVGSEDLMLNSLIENNVSAGYNDDYVSSHIVLSESGELSYSEDLDFRGYPGGEYTVCPLTYYNGDDSRLPTSGSTTNYSSIVENILLSGICGEVADTCISFQINPVLDTIRIDTSICQGGSIDFLGENYNETGVYFIGVKENSCDTLIRFEVDVVDFDASIQSSALELTCADPQVTLTAMGNRITAYSWSTPDGVIDGDPSLQTIEASAPGLYICEVSDGTCFEELTIEITNSIDLPTLEILGDTLDCVTSNVTLIGQSFNTVSTYQWESNQPFVDLGDRIEASLPGDYILTIMDDQGCQARLVYELIQDLAEPLFSLSVDTLGCSVDSVQAKYVGDQPAQFTWSPIGSYNAGLLEPFFSESGFYELTITGSNGCTAVENVEVLDTSETLNPTLMGDTLTCEMPQITLQAGAGFETYQWFRGSTQLGDSEGQSVSVSGNYTVIVTDASGCTGDATVFVEEQKDSPPLMVRDSILTCINDTLSIPVQDSDPSISYNWRGPLDFQAFGSPVRVWDVGIYVVTAIDANGCTAERSFEITKADDLPDISITGDTIRCGNDTIRLEGTPSVGLDFLWSGPGIVAGQNTAVVAVELPGEYVVEVTDQVTGCTTREFIDVIDIRDELTVEVEAEVINCINDSVQLITTVDQSYSSILWSGTGFDSDQESPFVKEAGEYSYEVLSENGCLFTGSILVDENKDLPVLTANDSTITCANRSLDLSVDSSIPLQSGEWYSDGEFLSSDILNTAEPGDFTFVAIGENECIDSIILTVGIDTISPNLDFSNFIDIRCDQFDTLPAIISAVVDETIDSYTWTSPSSKTYSTQEISVVEPGLYELAITDSQGCVQVESIDITDRLDYVDYAVDVKNIDCKGDGFIAVDVSDNYQNITWDSPISISDGELEFAADATGDYIFVLESNEDCWSVDTLTIDEEFNAPVVLSSFTDTLSCAKPTITAGFGVDIAVDSIVWINETKVVSLDTAAMLRDIGLWRATIYGTNGCTSTDSLEVFGDLVGPNLILEGDTLNCVKNRVDINLSADVPLITAVWQGPDPDFDQTGTTVTIKDSGWYYVEATSDNGCPSIDSIFIVNDQTVPEISIQDTFFLPCNGSGVDLTVSSPQTLTFYKWVGTTFFSTDRSPNVTEPQVVNIFAASNNGCNSSDSAVVVIDERRADFSVIGDTILCDQPSVTLSGLDFSDDFDFYWEDFDGQVFNSGSIDVTVPGDYKFVVSTDNFCKDSLILTVPIDTVVPKLDLELLDIFQCENRTLRVASGLNHFRDDLDFLWTSADGVLLDSLSEEGLVFEGGSYTFSVLDTINGCANMETIIIEEEEQELMFDMVEFQDPLCLGDENGIIDISLPTTGYGPYFQFFEGQAVDNLTFNDLDNGKYEIIIRDSLGCELDTIIRLNDGFELILDLPQDTFIQLGDSVDLTFGHNSELPLTTIEWSTDGEELCLGCEVLTFSSPDNTVIDLLVINEDGCIDEASIDLTVRPFFNYKFANIIDRESTMGNDVLLFSQDNAVQGIEKLVIFDKWGNVMLLEENHDFVNGPLSWDGTFNGSPVDQGVYVVIIDLLLINGQKRTLARDVTILR